MALFTLKDETRPISMTSSPPFTTAAAITPGRQITATPHKRPRRVADASSTRLAACLHLVAGRGLVCGHHGSLSALPCKYTCLFECLFTLYLCCRNFAVCVPLEAAAVMSSTHARNTYVHKHGNTTIYFDYWFVCLFVCTSHTQDGKG